MAENTEINVLNTRIKLRYAPYSEWQSSTVQLLEGEVAFCYVEANNEDFNNTNPLIVFKIGDGTKTFKDLDWTSAKAMDVYDWAKAENLVIEKAGDGDVVASIEWDSTNKKFVCTTTTLGSLEGFTQLQQSVSQLAEELTAAKGRLTAAEEAITALQQNFQNILKTFVGTKEEYEEANKQGLIAVGTIVYILDDDEDINGGATSSILGQGVLGYMILG